MTVRAVLDDIKKNITISKILRNHNVSNGTYYRIKNGDYNHLLEKQKEIVR